MVCIHGSLYGPFILLDELLMKLAAAEAACVVGVEVCLYEEGVENVCSVACGLGSVYYYIMPPQARGFG